MTAKEKAKELIEKFYGLPTGNTNRCVDWATATESALITCDEVLGYMGADRGAEFWQEVKQEVKQEIEKL